MERTPNQGGEYQHAPLHLVPRNEDQDEQHQESHDEQVIREGIERALREGTEIDDRTARYIASQLHEGQTSALYSLASTGAIAEEVHDELTRDFDQQPDHVKWWINWLGTYCLTREDKGPVAGWAESATAIDRAEARTTQQPGHDEDEAQARQALMERLATASVTRLGDVATVITFNEATSHTTVDSAETSTPDSQHDDQAASTPNEPDEPDEPDTFPWTDAARWSPDVSIRKSCERHVNSRRGRVKQPPDRCVIVQV